MKKIVLINGSPKIQSSFSGCLIDKISNELRGMNLILNISIRGRSFSREEKYEIVNQSDLIILVVPVYSKALPSIVLEFLEGLEDYMERKSLNRKRNFYCISHASAINGLSNYNSLEIAKIFAEKTKGIQYFGGLGIGGGAYLNLNRKKTWNSRTRIETKEKLKYFISIIDDEKKLEKDIYSDINMSKIRYGIQSNINWIKMGLGNKENSFRILNHRFTKINIEN